MVDWEQGALHQEDLNVSNSEDCQSQVIMRGTFEVEKYTLQILKNVHSAILPRVLTLKSRQSCQNCPHCATITSLCDPIWMTRWHRCCVKCTFQCVPHVTCRSPSTKGSGFLLSEFSCHFGPALPLKKAFLILSELLMRSFTDNLLMLSLD